MKKIGKLLVTLMAVMALAFTANAATEAELKANLTRAGVKKSSIDEYAKTFGKTDVKEIEKILNQAIKLDSKNYYAKEDLAAIYITQQQGKEAEAVKLLEEAIKLDSKNTIPYVNLLHAYTVLNRPQQYVDTMNNLINNIPDFPLGYRTAAIFLTGNNRKEEAIPYIEKTIETLNNVSENKYPELLQDKNLLLVDSYGLEILNYIDLGRTQRAIDLFVSRRSAIRAISSDAEKHLLDRLKTSNETLKTSNKKVYNENLKKLGLGK